MNILQSFPDMIRIARQAKKMSFREVSRFVGISAGCISDMERGKRLPPKDCKILEKFAKLLDIDKTDLIRSAKITRKAKTNNALGCILSTDPLLAFNCFQLIERGYGYKLRDALREAIYSTINTQK